MTFFHSDQLLAWTMLEFDPAVLGFEAVNRWFDHDTGSIFIGFYVRYMENSRLLYIPNPELASTLREFEKYAKVYNVGIFSIVSDRKAKNDTLFWNRINILSVLASQREKLSDRNLKKFVRSLKRNEITIGELEQMEHFHDQEAVAYAFELTRTGYFFIPNLDEELLYSLSVLKVSRSVKK